MSLPGVGSLPREVRFNQDVLDEHQAYMGVRQTLVPDRGLTVVHEKEIGTHFIVQAKSHDDIDTAQDVANTLRSELRSFDRDNPVHEMHEAVDVARINATEGSSGINFMIAGVRLYQENNKNEIEGVAATTGNARVDLFRTKGFFKKYLVHEPVSKPLRDVQPDEWWLNGDPDSMDNLTHPNKFTLKPGDRLLISSHNAVTDSQFVDKLGIVNQVDPDSISRSPQNFVDYVAADSSVEKGELSEQRGAAAIYIEYEKKRSKVGGLLAKLGLNGAGVKQPPTPETSDNTGFTKKAAAKGAATASVIGGYFALKDGETRNPIKLYKQHREEIRARKAENDNPGRMRRLGARIRAAYDPSAPIQPSTRTVRNARAGRFNRYDRANLVVANGLTRISGRRERYYTNHINDTRYEHWTGTDEELRTDLEERRARKGALIIGGLALGLIAYAAGRYYHTDIVPSHLKIQFLPWTHKVDLGDGDGIDIWPTHGTTSAHAYSHGDMRDGGMSGFLFDDDTPTLPNPHKHIAQTPAPRAPFNPNDGAPTPPAPQPPQDPGYALNVKSDSALDNSYQGLIHGEGHQVVGEGFNGHDASQVYSDALKVEPSGDFINFDQPQAGPDVYVRGPGDFGLRHTGPAHWSSPGMARFIQDDIRRVYALNHPNG